MPLELKKVSVGAGVGLSFGEEKEIHGHRRM